MISEAMPAAAKKGKKKKSAKKSAKKGLKGLQSIAEVLKIVRQQYELKCKEFNSYPHPDVKKLINQYAENNTLLAKVSEALRSEMCNIDNNSNSNNNNINNGNNISDKGIIGDTKLRPGITECMKRKVKKLRNITT